MENTTISILKGKVAQYPKSEILNEEDRLAKGWLSVEVRDSDGELIPTSEFEKSLNVWMKRGAFISDQHSNRIIGKGLRWYKEKHPSGHDGIMLDYQIFNDLSTDDEVWSEIKSGERSGLSFGGRATKKPKTKSDGETGEITTILRGVESMEVASVKDPANDLALNTAVNYLAKSKKDVNIKDPKDKEKDIISMSIFGKEFQILTDEEKKLVNAAKKEAEEFMGKMLKKYSDIQKPFAGFENFDSCVEAQMDKGNSEESAKKICGSIQARTEDKKKKDGDYGPHSHDEENSEGLHSHPELEDKKIKNISEKLNKIKKSLENVTIRNIENKLEKVVKALKKQKV